MSVGGVAGTAPARRRGGIPGVCGGSVRGRGAAPAEEPVLDRWPRLRQRVLAGLAGSWSPQQIAAGFRCEALSGEAGLIPARPKILRSRSRGIARCNSSDDRLSPLTAAMMALSEWALCQSGQETYELTPLRRGEGSKHGLLDLFENGVESEQCVGALES